MKKDHLLIMGLVCCVGLFFSPKGWAQEQPVPSESMSLVVKAWEAFNK